MKIAFITDLHIDAPGNFPLGLDTRAQFLKTLDYAADSGCEALILGGDLCHKTGDRDIYSWVKNEVYKRFDLVYAVPGNHDDPVLMAEIFGTTNDLHENELYNSHLLGGVEFLFSDTSSGYMSESQWSWLFEKAKKQHTDVFIIMHHPPVLVGSKHMEPKYQFNQMSKAAELFKEFNSKQFHVFCGHYHLDRTVVSGNMHLYLTPSTFVQIHPQYSDFVRGSDFIGYREIIVGEGSGYCTETLITGSIIPIGV